MRFRVGLRKRFAGPGDVVEVAPGVVHSFANAGEGEARVNVEVRPALAMEEMLAEVVAMARAGRMNRRGLPRNLRDLALLARRYDQEAHAPLLAWGSSDCFWPRSCSPPGSHARRSPETLAHGSALCSHGRSYPGALHWMT